MGLLFVPRKQFTELRFSRSVGESDKFGCYAENISEGNDFKRMTTAARFKCDLFQENATYSKKMRPVLNTLIDQ